MSERIIDTNGWIEVRDNPLTRVGVFPYSGASLGEGFIPEKMYNVYRPAESLEDPLCMESFRLLPITNDHPSRLLGNPREGFVAAEDKGVQGVTGEEIHFDGEFLRGPVKVFGQELADDIKSGKKQLSAGYNFLCLIQKGVYNGIEYEIVQKNIRGNHVSVVDEGRSGPEVSVLDKKESQGEKMNPAENLESVYKENGMQNDAYDDTAGEALSLEHCMAKIKEIEKKLEGMGQNRGNEGEVAQAHDVEEEKGKSEMKEERGEKEESVAVDEEETKKDGDEKYPAKGMDAAALEKTFMSRLSQRNNLAETLSHVIGAFDASEMTVEEVSKYGVKKLGINCESGQEKIILEGYLLGKRHGLVNSSQSAMDSNEGNKPSVIQKYLSGE